MKALTLYLPWALLVLRQRKRWETRGWRPSYRGPLIIHAANRWENELEALALREPFRSALGLNRPDARGELRAMVEEVRGCALCVVRLGSPKPTASARLELSHDEVAFGNYTPGRWAWPLHDLVALRAPVRVRGRQGLWDLDPQALEDPRIQEVAS